MPLDSGSGHDLSSARRHRHFEDDLSAIRILNQLVYVDPSTHTTIVKLSANRMYGTSTEESTNRDVESVEFLRAIAQHSNQASPQER